MGKEKTLKEQEKTSITQRVDLWISLASLFVAIVSLIVAVIACFTANNLSRIGNEIALKSNPIDCEIFFGDAEAISANMSNEAQNNSNTILYSEEPFTIQIQKGDYSGDYSKIIFAVVEDNTVDLNTFTKEEILAPELDSNYLSFSSTGQFGMIPKSSDDKTIHFYLSLIGTEENQTMFYHRSIYIILQSISGEYYYFPMYYICDLTSDAKISTISTYLINVEHLYNRHETQAIVDQLIANSYVNSDYTVDTFTSQIESELTLIRSKLEP